MNELTRAQQGAVTQFRPDETKERVSVLEAAIRHAKNMESWEAGWEAVDRLIAEQGEFVQWWDANVGINQGPGRGKTNAARGAFSAELAEEKTGIAQQRVSRWRKYLSAKPRYREALFGAAHRKAMADEHNHRAQGTGENEWYTPDKYLTLARKVLGEIDLDPASSAKAQLTVGAKAYFSTEQNGLNQEWHGRVWLNPPYAQPLIGQFVEKLVEERSADRVEAAIMLTHNYTDTAWFHKGCEIADAICFTRGRIKFVDAQGNDCAPTQGQAFFYFGDDVPRFASVFIDVGFVVAPCRG